MTASPVLGQLAATRLFQDLQSKLPDVAAHSLRVGERAADFSEHSGLADPVHLFAAGLCHDLGKLFMPELVSKPGKLTESEWQEMTTHPQRSVELMSAYPELQELTGTVLAHHERLDGTGYPRGLVAHQIPLEAQILAVTDVYDALSERRSYHAGLTPGAAAKKLIEIAVRCNHLDRELTTDFVFWAWTRERGSAA